MLKMSGNFWALLCALVAVLSGVASVLAQTNEPRAHWPQEWPNTDFSKITVDPDEILDVGERDRYRALDRTEFVAAHQADHIADGDIVIAVTLNGKARAYPISIVSYHEIVNEDLNGTPIAVTFCPLCNTAIVFDRRLEGRILDFGVSGKLRHADLVMYDRQTESWWQQFTGEGIVGSYAGEKLKIIPARLMAMANFRTRFPEGEVLVDPEPGEGRTWQPDFGKLTAEREGAAPSLYRGALPEGMDPMALVLVVGDRAWTMEYVKNKRSFITEDGLTIRWTEGWVSPDGVPSLGEVTVERDTDTGVTDVAYGIDYAFAFHAFHPDSDIVGR